MALDIIRVQLFDKGHSFDEIDNLTFEQLGLILGVWSGNAKVEAKARKRADKGLKL